MPLNAGRRNGARRDPLYDLIAVLSRFQLHAHLRGPGCSKRMQLVFSITMGAAAIGTITAAAVLTDLPLLFPPLAPSAFILFTTPLAATAAPRSVILGHTSALLIGLLSVIAVSIAAPGADLGDPMVMNGPRIVAIMLAMGATTKFMLLFRCSHPPAAATALLAAMGWFSDPLTTAALVASAVLLSLEAVVLLRIFGGLPYPLWNPAHDLARFYGTLSGTHESDISYWDRMHEKLLDHHDDLPSERHEHIM